MCNLWSTPTFQSCSSLHICDCCRNEIRGRCYKLDHSFTNVFWYIFAIYATFTLHDPPLLRNSVFQQWPPVTQVAYPVREPRQTDRHGRATRFSSLTLRQGCRTCGTRDAFLDTRHSLLLQFSSRPTLLYYEHHIYEGEQVVRDYHYWQWMLRVYNFLIQTRTGEKLLVA
jgi:hypothetical protein